MTAAEVKSLIADAGYDAEYGARPLRRVIQDKVEDRLSEGLLSGWIKPGDTIRLELDREREIQFVVVPETSDAPALAEAVPG